MKVSPSEPRLSIQDLIVVMVVGAVSLLGLAAVFDVPVLPAIGVMLASGLAVLIYGLWPKPAGNAASTANYTTQSEDDYLRSQARLADNISDAVIMIDRRQRVIYANPSAVKLLNIDTLGRPLSTYIRESGARDMVRQALDGDMPEPVTYHVEDPTDRYIRLMASPFTVEGSDPPRQMAIAFFYDITEYMRVDDMRADFLANASHELKTPIASLLGYIETLRGHAKNDPEAQEKFLAIMQAQAERMQRLINDLLSLRRIEQIEHMVPTETADMHLAARAAAEAVQPLAEIRGVKINFKKEENALVTGNQDELVQLILNLLDNAVKISAKGSRVRISITHEGIWNPGQAFTDNGFSPEAQSRRIVSPPRINRAFYVLKIRDNGPGFSREHLPRIGERFYRIAGDLSSQEKGTGLGLAIVKHITRRHRGGLMIQSGAGEGTEFTVLIPASESAAG